MNKDGRIFVAGHHGLVGSGILRKLRSAGFDNLILRTRQELDLRDQAATQAFFERERPEYVLLAAAKVGGILGNSSYPADFIADNLAIELNVISSAFRCGVKKLLFLGSSCIYPRDCPQPISEDSLLTGPLEETNQWYAVAKIAGLKLCQAFNLQKGTCFITAMPTNVYGPYDNFDLETSHVVPALIRKFHEAKLAGTPVMLWGTGNPRREFVHVDDLADACVFLMERYEGSSPINVGTGTDRTIRELADLCARIVGYRGEVLWDREKPDGTPRKVLDVSRLDALGWRAQIPLEQGLRSTYEWFQQAHSRQELRAGIVSR